MAKALTTRREELPDLIVVVLEMIEAWGEALEDHRLKRRHQYNNVDRLAPMVFIACDQLRDITGRRYDSPIASAAARFGDWRAHGGLSFFRSEPINKALKFSIEHDYLSRYEFGDYPFDITDKGHDAVNAIRFEDDRDGTFNGNLRTNRRDVEEAIIRVVSNTATLTMEGMRDYVFDYGLKICHDGRFLHVSMNEIYLKSLEASKKFDERFMGVKT